MTQPLNGHTLHILKIKEEFFRPVLLCIKKCELRKDDRDYRVGDRIHFIKDNGEEFTHYESNLFRVSYVYKGTGEYGLAEGYCIMSLTKLK